MTEQLEAFPVSVPRVPPRAGVVVRVSVPNPLRLFSDGWMVCLLEVSATPGERRDDGGGGVALSQRLG